MDDAIRGSDVDLLRDAGLADEDVRHSVHVAEKAVELARRTGAALALDLVARGGVFHDLGKAMTHEVEHGTIGAALGHGLGLPRAVTEIMEMHIRGGLTPEEAHELALPEKDLTPRRLEEKLVIYADRLVDIIDEGLETLRDEREAEERFEEILRAHKRYGKNAKTTERYLGYHREIQSLISTAGGRIAATDSSPRTWEARQ